MSIDTGADEAIAAIEHEMGGEEHVDYDTPPEPIEDPDAINRRMWRLHHAKLEMHEFDARAQRMMNELEDKIVREHRRFARKVEWLERSLELTAASLWTDDPKRTSVVLPNGALRSKDPGVAWEIANPKDDPDGYAKLLAWAQKEAPETVDYPPTPEPRVMVNEVKKALKPYALAEGKGPQSPAHPDGLVVVDGGEVVPGVRVVKKPREFTVDLDVIDVEPF